MVLLNAKLLFQIGAALQHGLQRLIGIWVLLNHNAAQVFELWQSFDLSAQINFALTKRAKGFIFEIAQMQESDLAGIVAHPLRSVFSGIGGPTGIKAEIYGAGIKSFAKQIDAAPTAFTPLKFKLMIVIVQVEAL